MFGFMQWLNVSRLPIYYRIAGISVPLTLRLTTLRSRQHWSHSLKKTLPAAHYWKWWTLDSITHYHAAALKPSVWTVMAGMHNYKILWVISTDSNKTNIANQQTASIFAALGDSTRLAIVAILCKGGAFSIVQLTENTYMSRQGVTKHLRVLADAGIVRDVKIGRERLWQLEQGKI